MPNFVSDDGTGFEPIMLIGEAPGATEDKVGKPFVGKSGSMLTSIWNAVGLHRQMIYLTNVYPYRPPGNDIKKIPTSELEVWTEVLHETIAKMHDPRVLVPTGNTALKALTGKTEITKRRGSIYGYEDRRGRLIKVIPTIHPAYVMPFRNPEMERPMRQDWARISEDCMFPELDLPKRTCYIEPDMDMLYDFLTVAREAEVMAVDSETIKNTAVIRAVGFSVDPAWALCIPYTKGYWGEKWQEAINVLKKLCALGNEKALQNGLFDSYVLSVNGIDLHNFRWDTMAQHHCLDSMDYGHDLAYMASVDTRQPYWKGMEHDPEEVARWGGKEQAMWAYCCIDNMVTLELSELYQTQIAALGKQEFYENHYRRMIPALLKMMLHGIRVDLELQRELYASLSLERDQLREKLAEMAGEDLIATKDFSKIKLLRFIYETMKMPKQYSTKNKKKSLSADVFTIKKLMNMKPKFEEAGQTILNFRRKRKLATEVDGRYEDKDGFIRCQYRFTTDSGRLASRGNPTGTGRNLQNVDREQKDIYVPDIGHIFVEVDLSQAENRDVNLRTGDAELVEIARRMPWEWDEHKFYASIIFGIPESEVRYAKRYTGKRSNHGCFTGDVEVLTHSGWVRFDEYQGQQLAQWNAETRNISFVTPHAVQEYFYDGILYHWETKGVSFSVTEEHRIADEEERGEVKFRRAKQQATRSRTTVPLSGLFDGPSAIGRDFARLLVATQADGCFQDGGVTFRFKRPRKIQRLREILKALQIRGHERRHKDGVVVFSIYKADAFFLYHWLSAEKVWGSWLLQLSGETLDTILDELWYWDGHIAKTSHIYYTAIRENANWIQTIAHLRGRRALVRRDNSCWRVYISQHQTARVKKEQVKKSSTRSIVYCVSVPSGAILIRHQGLICCCGQSNYGMSGAMLADVLLKDGFVYTPAECQGFIDAIMARFPAKRHWQEYIRQLVIRDRRLVNVYGREYLYTYHPMTAKTFREAFSHQPQGDIGDHLNQRGVLPFQEQYANDKAILVAQVHDSMLISCDPSVAFDVVSWLKPSLESPLLIPSGGYRVEEDRVVIDESTLKMEELSIPMGVSVGRNWGAMHEFKRFPSRQELESKIEELLNG